MVRIWVQWLCSAAIASLWIIPGTKSALAQNIIFDGTLRRAGSGPAPRLSSSPNNFVYPISVNDGQLVGNNLFHSFARFSLNSNETASFQINNPVPIRNVLVRVTGGVPSTINGRIAVDNGPQTGNANLFFINPNGISFGSSARLSLGGSFFATTIDAIKFPGGGQFSATNPTGREDNQLLTLRGDPSGFLASQRSIPPISVSGPLTVPSGRSLVLLGGDIQLDGTALSNGSRQSLTAFGGRIELGGVSGSAEIGLTTNGNLWSLNFPSQTPRSDVALRQFNVQVIASNGGDIAINARNLLISNSQIAAGIRAGQGSENSQAGNVSLNAIETIAITNQSKVGNSMEGTGRGGNLDIQTQRLTVQNSQVNSNVSGIGNAGNLTIIAGESVDLSGDYVQGTDQGPGGLFAQVNKTPTAAGVGQGGNLTVITPLLRVREGSKVQTATFGQGNAGNVLIQSQTVEVIDTPDIPNIYPTAINAGVTLTLNPELDARGGLSGNGGNLTIETDRLTVQGGQITVENFGVGAAGNLFITADRIQLSDRAKLTAETRSGQGGNITLNVNSLLQLQGNSQISTTAGNAQTGGDGGNITINIPRGFVVSPPLQNSDITANAFSGRGGQVTINAQGIFGLVPRTKAELEQLLGNGPLDPQRLPTNDITASSQFGLSGTIVINTLNVDPSQGLVALPVNLTDPSQQIVQNCTPGSRTAAGSFVVTGRGGIPQSPDEPLESRATVAKWVPLPEEMEEMGSRREEGEAREELSSRVTVPLRSLNASHEPEAASSVQNPKSKIQNPIVEAQGWIVNADGSVELVANEPISDRTNRWGAPVTCQNASDP